MTDFKTENKLGVGEILICNKDTRGKFESLKYFIGKVIINIGGGGEKIYIIEEKDKVSCEVKSIQSRGNFKSLMNTMYNLKNETLEEEEKLTAQMSKLDIAPQLQIISRKATIDVTDQVKEQSNLESYDKQKSFTHKKQLSSISENPLIKKESVVKEILVLKKESSKFQNIIEEENENVDTNTNLNIIGFKRDEGKENHKNTVKFSSKLENINYVNNTTEISEKILNTEQNIPDVNPRLTGKLNQIIDQTNRITEELTDRSKYGEITEAKTSVDLVEKENQIIQIVKGKYHTLKLTIDGKVYGSGQSYFGVIGLGGSKSSEKSKLLPNLANIKIVQIASGMFHSLALSDIGDLYVWGMGFEGQLGLTSEYKIASSPRYLNFFYKAPVKFITCGHNYSLCITNDYRLWGWGENKLGQLGLGKIQIVEKPTHIEIQDSPGNQEGITTAESYMGINNERLYTNKPLHPCYVSAGFAHTAVVTEEGYLATFGLNINGQLGLGNTITTFSPRLIEKCDNGSNLGKITKVCCSTNGTFIVTNEGRLFTCGSGEIGHGEIGVMKLPRIVTETRIYQHIFCNDNSVVAFCPLRIVSISPNCGPATGNTILSIIGSAFKDFSKLSVRFIFGGIARDVKANFEKLSRTISVKTPNFIELCPNLEFPSECIIQLTFDGNYFTDYKYPFLIYSSSIKISGIEPKCGPITGGKELFVKINLDSINTKYLFSLTCGFQAKPNIDATKKQKVKKINNSHLKINETEDSKSLEDRSSVGLFANRELANINPMDYSNIENQIDKANWYCCFATYEKGMISCNIPKIENFNQSQVEYNVDVAVNGQQFSGYPMIYKFYEIKIDKMEPSISATEGSLHIKIGGVGLFDSLTKKARIKSKFGERYSDLQWDKNERSLLLVSNPISWMINDEDELKKISPYNLYEDCAFDVEITMNNVEFIKAGSYRYCDVHIKRIAYNLFSTSQSYDDRLAILSKPEQLSIEEKMMLELIVEDKKKKEEVNKKIIEEDNTINNVYKRPYCGLNLYGEFFPKTETIKVKFVAQTCEYDVIAFYKNSRKVSCLIPEMQKLPPGQHELLIKFSLNGQQYYNTNKKILFIAPEYGLHFDEIIKLDELDSKGYKKGVAKQLIKK